MHGTEEASNGGKVKVRIIHGLKISQKNSYNYSKNLEVIKNQALREASNGGKVKVRIIHGLKISQKNSYNYSKNLEVIKNQALRACS